MGAAATQARLKLPEEDQLALRHLEDCTEDQVLALMRDLRTERSLEFQIYASREQWFWVPWTTCLAGTILALSSGNHFAALCLPYILGVTAWILGRERKKGLSASLDTLNVRHSWVFNITQCAKHENTVRPFDFDHRVRKQKGYESSDPIHDEGFRYAHLVIRYTPYLWLLLATVGTLRFIYFR
jgi:hypothetical protein